jgi:4-amino-4-deoxy-L-arabinose transferase-like glycosyltransferase
MVARLLWTDADKRIRMTTSTAPFNRKRLSRDLVVVGLLPLFFLLPFATKAVHIDDPVYLWLSQHILESPVDFYGFEANWWGVDEPAYELHHNPPGIGYFLALVALVAGWSEVGFHVAMALCASLFSAGTYFLARTLTQRPLLAACATICTPMFVVSGTNLMTDIPMATTYVWAATCWIYGIKQNRKTLLFAAACCMALSPMFKYPGLNVAPLLFAFTWMKTGRLGWWTLYFLIPAVVLAGYQMITLALYDMNHIAFALGTIAQFDDVYTAPIQHSLFTGMLFAGGSMISILCCSPWLWNPRTSLISVALGIAVAAVVIMGLLDANRVAPEEVLKAPRLTPFLIVQGVFLLAGGIQIASLAIRDLAVRRDAEAFLLFLWLAGTFVFATALNWSVNVRVLLPMLPPAAILLARRLDEREDAGYHPRRVACAFSLAVSAAISLYVGWADYSLAKAGKTAASYYAKHAADQGATVYFQGHWGFQYYMEEHGMTYFDEEISPKKGDLIVLPQLFLMEFLANSEGFQIRGDLGLSIPLDCWASTLNRHRGAGFYSHNFGPMPYTFGAPPAEAYTVMEFVSDQNEAASGRATLSLADR